jgi:acetyl-CoA acetyltransferase
MNPEAVMQQPLDRKAYRDSRFVARPLRLFDYCLVTDGAVCYIVTTLERARALRKPPVRIAGFTERAVLREHFVPEDLWSEACAGMASEIFERSGLTRDDVSALQVYDNFSVSVLWALEGFGFCEPGEALDWIQGGRIRVGGDLPVNTSGGMMSEAYMQGWNHQAEAIRQIRGECGNRQVPDCESVLYACLAPVSGATLLSRDA